MVEVREKDHMLAQDYLLLAGGVAARPRAAAELARLQLAPAHAVPAPDFARTRDTPEEFWAVSNRGVGGNHLPLGGKQI